jgi:hypothetical protein
LLASSTVAGQDACVHYLAGSAALQQWGQAALAFLLLHTSVRPLAADDISAGLEALLEQQFRVSHFQWWTRLCCMQLSKF